jgi:two-component system sensor histidine kinase ComP
MNFNFLGFSIIPQKDLSHQISAQAAEIFENIVNEMGAEIHDDLIQKIYLLQLNLKHLEQAVDHPIELQNGLIKMEADLKMAIQSIRRISKRLNAAENAEAVFSQQISILCQNMEIRGGNHLHFEQVGVEFILPEVVKKYLYRMTQELIHNAFKHSTAWHIWVRLIWDKNKLVVEVEDDGTGEVTLDETIKKLNEKYNSLRMRAEAIQAKIKYGSGKKGLLATIAWKNNIL